MDNKKNIFFCHYIQFKLHCLANEIGLYNYVPSIYILSLDSPGIK